MKYLLMALLALSLLVTGCQLPKLPNFKGDRNAPPPVDPPTETAAEKFAREAEIGVSLAQLKQSYGEPTDDAYWEGGRYVSFSHGTYFISDAENVFGRIVGTDEDLDIFGAKVGMSFAEVNRVFGVDPTTPPEFSDMDGDYVAFFERDGYNIRFHADSADSLTQTAFVTTELANESGNNQPPPSNDPPESEPQQGFPDISSIMNTCPSSGLTQDGNTAKCSQGKSALIVTGDWTQPERAIIMFDSNEYYNSSGSSGPQMLLTFMEALYGPDGEMTLDELIGTAREKAEERSNGNYEAGTIVRQVGNYQTEVTGAPNFDLSSGTFGMEYGFNGIISFQYK
jgi:hypothetical protein